jgi:hypothetical protein
MSRSVKKYAIVWCSRKWTRLKERAFRRRVHQAVHEIETDFNPDRDWEEAAIGNKKFAEYGTSFGMMMPPDPDDSLWDHGFWEKRRRK